MVDYYLNHVIGMNLIEPEGSSLLYLPLNAEDHELTVDPVLVSGLGAAFIHMGESVLNMDSKEVYVKWSGGDSVQAHLFLYLGDRINNLFVTKGVEQLDELTLKQVYQLNVDILDYAETKHPECIEEFLISKQPAKLSGLREDIITKIIDLKESAFNLYNIKVMTNSLNNSPPIKQEKILNLINEYSIALSEYQACGDCTTLDLNLAYQDHERVHEINLECRNQLSALSHEARSKVFNQIIDQTNKEFSSYYDIFKIPLIEPKL